MKKCVAKGKRGEKQQKHNKMELKRMIYSYQQSEKGEQMICETTEKRREKRAQNKGGRNGENAGGSFVE